MAGERLCLSPVLDDSGNSPLELSGQDGSLGNGVLLMSHEYPPPPTQPQWVAGADSEGESLANTRYSNRTINLTLRVAEPSDGASTNLATNPKCAVDTTGWTNSGLGTMQRSVLYGSNPDGIGGVGADTALNVVGSADGQYAYLSIAVTSGLSYSFSAYVYLTANSATGVRLDAYNATPTLKFNSSNVTTTGSWQRLSVTFTADSTATWRFGLRQVGAGAVTAFGAGFMVEQSSSLGNYFDGDSPGCAWTGTHHSTTSTRPASGGNRFLKILDDLQEATDRINREGGVLMRVAPGGEPLMFDVSECQFENTNDNRFIHSRRTQVSLSFTAKPFWRGVYQTLSDHAETTLPCIVGTDTISGGQVPSLGKLVVDEDQASATQKWLVWGVQSRTYDSSANAALFYEAEGRTALGGAATAVRSGASGGGSNVMRHTTLIPTDQAILSTQATGGGAHLSHIGTYRVFARVFDPNATQGAVKLKFQWATGDFTKRTTNAAVSPAAIGDFSLVDLGYISIPKVTLGTQRWEGRVLASSTNPGDDIDVDYLMFVPVDEGAGQVTAVDQASVSSSTLTAYDTFVQAAGVVASGAAPLGGNYDPGTAGASTTEDGDADDFSFSGSPNFNVTRNPAGADSSLTNGRYIQLDGSSTIAAVEIQIDVALPSIAPAGKEVRGGILARLVDTDNWLMAVRRNLADSGTQLSLYKRVAGTVTVLRDVRISDGQQIDPYTIKLSVDASGNYAVYTAAAGSPLGAAMITGQDTTHLQTGQALDDGKVGFYDACDLASAGVRTYDNFSASVPTTSQPLFDAAMFASQSIQIGPDSVLREDSGGTIWQPPGKYEGAFLRLPATGREDRTLRTIVKACRLDPATGADSAIDDISYQLQQAPRGITLPEPS